MPNLPDYSWPPMDQRRVIGKPTKRRDGLEKSTGRAKYSSDLKPPGMLFGALLTSPYAHARITSIDTSEAEHIAGVTAVRVMTAAGKAQRVEGLADRRRGRRYGPAGTGAHGGQKARFA